MKLHTTSSLTHILALALLVPCILGAADKTEVKKDDLTEYRKNDNTWIRWAKDNVKYGVESYNWAKSAAFFVPTLAYNNYLGQGPCSFHSMLADHAEYPEPVVIIGLQDHKAVIKEIADGLKAPLYLSAIPQSAEFFQKIREHATLPARAAIGLHTLNRRFEQWLTALKTTAKDDGFVLQLEYSTTDFTAPKQIDLLRGVQNIGMRDWAGRDIDVVHCKAGKGRSATLLCAYLLKVYHSAPHKYEDGTLCDVPFCNDQIISMIIAYAKERRPLVNINSNQKPALEKFYDYLVHVGSFENMCQLYQVEINRRNAEFHHE